MKRPSPTRRVAIMVIAAALVGGACGSSSDDGTTGSAEPRRPASIEVAIPDLPVNDLQAGTEIPLRSVLGGDKPILLWFWAPH